MELKVNKLKFKCLLPVAAFFLGGVAQAQELPEVDLLTGDTRLACEAVLCLSSGTRPGECAPALRRYFGITDPRPHKMIQKRINFLNMCPAANEPDMPGLITAIANGAGRCDAQHLNAYNRKKVVKRVCTPSFGMFGESTCTTEVITVVSDKKPSYCRAYEGHDFTFEIETHYVGTPTTGGRWVEPKDYDKALQEYNDNYQSENKGNSRTKVEYIDYDKWSDGRR